LPETSSPPLNRQPGFAWCSRSALPQHPDEHRSQRPVLLAVDLRGLEGSSLPFCSAQVTRALPIPRTPTSSAAPAPTRSNKRPPTFPFGPSRIATLIRAAVAKNPIAGRAGGIDYSGSQLRPLPSIGPTTLRCGGGSGRVSRPVGVTPSHHTHASGWGQMELCIAESPRSEDRGLRFVWS